MDRGYSSSRFREHSWSIGARPAIPTKVNEASGARSDRICNNRDVVERPWAMLNVRRAATPHYDKTAQSFMGVLCLAAAID
jgi:transposase